MTSRANSVPKLDKYSTFIEDPISRGITFCKRKCQILKKLIELKKMCGIDIFLAVFDKEKQKLLEFRSENEFDANMVKDLLT